MLDTNKEIRELSEDERVSQAQQIVSLEHFKNELSRFDNKYTQALKYGNPRSEEYAEYAYKLQGVREFLTLLVKPIAIEDKEVS